MSVVVRLALAALLFGVVGLGTAHAQQQAGCKQSGTVTPGHIATWTTNCVLQDGGTPTNPQITGGVGVASGNQQSICTQNSKSGAVSQLCLGSPPTGGVLTFSTLGGGTPLPFQFVINGVTYTWPFPSAPINVPFLAATSFGVVADGVTSNDVALANAVNACAAAGTALYLPPGQILLSGAATINLRNCAVHGVGVPGGLLGTPSSYGSMFLFTSISVKPFNIGSNWSMSDVNFFWPNQTVGTQFYPPLFSPVSETTSTTDWYLDHVNIINAYDGIVTGGGRFNVTDSNIYAMRDAFRVANIGDSFRLNGIHFTPGPWFTMTNFTAPYTNVSSTNVILHAQAGGNNTINFSAVNIGAFAWGTSVKIDASVTVGETEFDGLFDTIQTMIDASASGAVWAGYSQTPIRGSAGCFSTCFKLGATGTLFIDGWTGGSSKTFVESAGASVYLSNVFAPGVGSIADGNDYYFVHLTANPGGGAVISLRNNSTTGVPSSVKVHGLTTDVAAARLIIQNSDFSFFNDVINAQSASTTVIQGNWSIGTQGSQSLIASSLATGGHGISYSNNVWDKPPQATITAGFGTGPTIQGGFSGVIFAGTGSTTGGSFQLPFVPIGPAGGSCNFTPSIGSNISASVSGSPPTWNILSENNIAGGQLFYNCGGVAQQ